MRKMATIRKIDEINPIDGADAIEVATVGGWKVVVKKGEFTAGDLAVYCEIDSWIPSTIAPFLTKPGHFPKVYEGVEGERLRTVKMRGQLSQGLLLNLDNVIPETNSFAEGDDVSEHLNIQKWEMTVPAQLAGQVKGNFPSVIPKTDQERVQNLKKEIEGLGNMDFEVTEKLEGSSMTCYLIDGEFGVCSRNMDLKRDENNSFWAVAIEQDIEERMRLVGDNFAIQGELIGPGIQGNIYKLSKPEFYVFDMYDIHAGMYLKPRDRRAIIAQMRLNHVPYLSDAVNVVGYDTTVQGLLDLAEGKSTLNPKQEREGIVFKAESGGMTFKAISNRYLIKQKD